MAEVKADPKVRADGLCLTCEGVRPERAMEERDPFCTSRCAREFFGTQLEYEMPSRWDKGAVCSGCGCPVDEETLGCVKCAGRHKARARTERERQDAA